jgi:hypothetical protein
MKKKLIIVALVGAVALTGCSSKKDSTKTGGNDAQVTASAPSTTGGFGAIQDLGSGVKVTITAPKSFTPGKFASNYLPGQAANIFDVTIANAGTAAIDPASISFTSASGTNACADVLDGDNGVSGPPTEAIAAGTSTTFKIAVGCDAKSGAPIEMTVTIGTKTAAINGKIA